jgi:histone H3/H4
MGSTEEDEEIIELVDVIEEGPGLALLYEKSLKELEESRKETDLYASASGGQADLFNEPENLEELNFKRVIKEHLEGKFSIEEIDISKESELQDEWEIGWASEEDFVPHKGQIEEIQPPELPEKEVLSEISEDQQIKRIGELESKTVEVIVREVSREVIESVAMKITPDITEAVIKAMNEKIERIAADLFPPIAEKMIKEEIEKLKEGGD